MFKKKSILFGLLAVLSLFTGTMAQVSTSKWQAEPIVIDGDGSEWGTNPRFFNTQSNVKYEFRNDARNLYLIIKSVDQSVQLQLLKAGFIVKLKVKTSPPTKTSITFPTLKAPKASPGKNKKGKNSDKPMDKPDTDAEFAPKEGYKPVTDEMVPDKLTDKSTTEAEFMPKDTAILDGFQYSNGKISSGIHDENSINFARSKSRRELTFYQLSIPLRELFGDNYKLESISDVPIQLQVVINALSQSSNNRSRGGGQGHSGGRGGGMGGGHGSGMGRGPGGEMGGESNIGELDGEMQGENDRGNSSMERKSFSIDFHLSTGK